MDHEDVRYHFLDKTLMAWFKGAWDLLQFRKLMYAIGQFGVLSMWEARRNKLQIEVPQQR